MQNPPPPPPSGGYPPPPPPAGGYAQPPPQMPGGYPVQGYAPQATYGGFWIRFVAAIIDSFIISIPVFIIGVIVIVIVGAGASSSNSQAPSAASSGAIAIIYLIAIAGSIGYFIYFWGKGSTLGMRLFKLRVADANTGQPIGFGRAALRYLGYIIAVIPCYIGLIWAAFDARKQGWHDKIASSVVLQG